MILTTFCHSILDHQAFTNRTEHKVDMAGANETELKEAFKLFDVDGDGLISAEELTSLISKVGGEMADAEAKALIHAADKDGNQGIDFNEFAKFWETLHGESNVSFDICRYKLEMIILFNLLPSL